LYAMVKRYDFFENCFFRFFHYELFAVGQCNRRVESETVRREERRLGRFSGLHDSSHPFKRPAFYAERGKYLYAMVKRYDFFENCFFRFFHYELFAVGQCNHSIQIFSLDQGIEEEE
jgi:hypothetical protein